MDTTLIFTKTVELRANLFIIFQELLCMSENLKCVKNVKVDDSTCLPPCIGLIVTSFSKTEKNVDLDSKGSL